MVGLAPLEGAILVRIQVSQPSNNMRTNIGNSKKQEYGKPLSAEEIIRLKKVSPTRSGCWEADWGPEPFSQMLSGGEADLTLTMVVHQESYFIIETHVDPSDKTDKGIATFTEAVKKQFTLPEILMVRDESLRDELLPLADALCFKIEVCPLKAIPQIRRDMKRMFG